jgi:hypothetical protein
LGQRLAKFLLYPVQLGTLEPEVFPKAWRAIGAVQEEHRATAATHNVDVAWPVIAAQYAHAKT